MPQDKDDKLHDDEDISEHEKDASLYEKKG
jgi:hypothetical protein